VEEKPKDGSKKYQLEIEIEWEEGNEQGEVKIA